jgi:ABC-2 type transport system ATP-binding protein
MHRYGARVPDADTLALDARALTKSYGTHRGIVDVDLQIAYGEVVGLVGANGAGKTTLMRTILDFVRPTAGAVRVFGLDSVKESVQVRQRSAYLPGELVFPPRLRGEEVLRRYTTARTALEAARVRSLTERLDLDMSRRVQELSKGNKQKLGLVLVFAPYVDLLVLDEPTSGLDPLLQREFAALVAERSSAGTTVLLSSHVMAEVEQIASRVALLREGRVAAVDDLAAVRAQSRRRGRVRPVDPADVSAVADALVRASRVSDVAVDGDTVAFACAGEMDAVIKILAGFRIAALDVAHADLEDAFLSAYDGPPDREHSR